MPDLVIEPRGPFSLAAAARFIAGWPPSGQKGVEPRAPVRLAFAADWFDGHGGVALREVDGVVHGDVVGTVAPEAARDQAARMLSLDHDAGDFPDVGRRDPVVGRLQRHLAGLRPVLFGSPYEAAAWSVLSARIRHAQALEIRRRLSVEHGAVLDVAGESMPAFPLPATLLGLEAAPGVPPEKLRRLHAVAEAALAGRLDAARLRGLPREAALADLQEIRGIGPFYARLILLRGAGTLDEPPTGEPRVRRAIARAYGLDTAPNASELARITDGWRPYRTWVALLMRVGFGEPGPP